MLTYWPGRNDREARFSNFKENAMAVSDSGLIAASSPA
jgi:hypothetical protein